MTEQEQRIAIAEFCGRKYHKPSEEEIKSGSYYQYEPDYLHDLNAMHEAEEFLDEPHYYQKSKYRDILHYMCSRSVWRTLHATASQRAEALLRTIGKWKD